MNDGIAARLADIIAEVQTPEFAVRLATETAARTDPWRWYCRLCGSKGDFPERAGRDTAAMGHLTGTRCGRHAIRTSAEAGRMLHVWSYGEPALVN